jgi:hypothetical protein
MLLLDIAYPPAPSQMAADGQQAGAGMVGLYVINQSLPGTVRDAAYIQAARGAIRVLPIVVPGNNPPGGGDWVIRELRARGITGGLVAIDLEAGSFPFASWVSDTVRRLVASGYRPWIYATSTVRRIYGDAEWWEALWDNNPVVYTGTVAHQYGGVTVNGRHYDASISVTLEEIMDLSSTAIFGLGHFIVSVMYGRPATGAEVQALGLKPDLSNLDSVIQTVENNVNNPAADVYKLQNGSLRKDLDALSAVKPPIVDVSNLSRIGHDHQLSGVAK